MQRRHPRHPLHARPLPSLTTPMTHPQVVEDGVQRHAGEHGHEGEGHDAAEHAVNHNLGGRGEGREGGEAGSRGVGCEEGPGGVGGAARLVLHGCVYTELLKAVNVRGVGGGCCGRAVLADARGAEFTPSTQRRGQTASMLMHGDIRLVCRGPI